ncbi:MAG: hypothetical protein IT318_01360, partial [Anaerolineales bacterium]|nr:hypothetical protein [Anaerolineales bacterium]
MKMSRPGDTRAAPCWDDRPHEECGLIGVFAPNEDVARMAYFGLHAL